MLACCFRGVTYNISLILAAEIIKIKIGDSTLSCKVFFIDLFITKSEPANNNENDVDEDDD